MKFELIIDKSKEESLTLLSKKESAFTSKIENLVMQYNGIDLLQVYYENEIVNLPIEDIECFSVIDGKLYAIDNENKRFFVNKRLYEIKEALPKNFITINKSSIANKNALSKFTLSFSGAVDAIFKSGYKEYVSRRCFAEIKRRIKNERLC